MALNNLGLGFVITAKDAASAVFAKVGSALGGLTGQGAQVTQNLDQAWEKIKSMGSAMKNWGNQGLAFLGAAAAESRRVGKSLREVASIADKSAFPMETIKQIAMDMALTYGGDMKVHANALYSAISAGASNAAQATAVLTAANKFAVGGLTDVDTATKAILGTLNAYTMDFSKATEVADKFTIAIKLGQTRAEEFAPILGMLAPSAHAAGVSLDEMMASIAVLTVSGLRTEASVTGMKAAISNIQKPTADAAAEAKRLGIEFNAAALRSKGMAGFLDSITNSSKYNADSMIKLFGSIEAVNAMQVLAAGGGAKFKAALTEMANSAGAADKAFQMIGVSAGELLAAAKQVAAVLIGEAIAPMFKAMTTATRYLVNAFNMLPKPIQKVIAWGMALGSVLLVVAGTIIGLIATIAGLVAAFAAVGWEVILIAAAAVIALMEYLGVAFVAAGAVIYAFWQAFQKNLGGIGTYLQETFGKAGDALKVFQAMFETGGKLTGDAAKSYMGLGEGVKAVITTVWMYWERLKNFAAGVQAGFDSALSTMGPAFASLVTSLKALGNALGFTQASAEENAAAFDMFGAVGKTIGEGLAAAFSFLVQVFQVVVDIATGVISGFKAMGPVFSVLGGAVGLIVQAFGELLGAFSQADVAGEKHRSGWQTLGAVVGAVAAIIVYVIAAIAWAISGLVGIVGSVVSGIVSIFSGIISVVTGVWTFLRGLFTGDWPTMWQGLAMVVFGVVEAIVGAVTAMVSAIASIIDSLGKVFGKDLGIKKAVEGAKKDMMKDLGGALGLPQQPKPTTTAPAPTAAPVAPAKPTPVATAPAKPGAPTTAPTAPGAPPAPATPPPTAPAPTPTAPPIPGVNAPSPALATAGAGGGGGNIDALAAKINAPAPITLTSNIKLDVDGQTLADIVDKHSTSTSNRSFGPGGTSKG